MSQWRAGTVQAWLEVVMAMPMYIRTCSENVKSGKVTMVILMFLCLCVCVCVCVCVRVCSTSQIFKLNKGKPRYQTGIHCYQLHFNLFDDIFYFNLIYSVCIECLY